jgi:hypothetical protein
MKISASLAASRISPSLSKGCLVILAVGLFSATAPGQGTIFFSNIGNGINAPVLLPDGITKLDGRFSAYLLAGPRGGVMTPISPLVAFSDSAPGYFNGGITTLQTVSPGGAAVVQVQIWLTREAGIHVPEIYPPLFGRSPILPIVVGGSLTQPPAGPALLPGFGNSPLILATPQLHMQLTATNTLVLSFANSQSSQYVLFTQYVLQQNPTLNEATWTTVSNFLSEAIIRRPSGTMFYRLQPVLF